MENSPVQMNWGNTCISTKIYLFQKQECLDHVFPMRTELACDRNTTYLWALLSWRTIHFMENRPIQLNCRNTFISEKNTIYGRSRSVLPIVSLWELIYIVKRILPMCQTFQVMETFTLCKLALFNWIGETHVSPGRIPSMLEARVSFPCFPYDNWVMWQEYSLSVRVFKSEKCSRYEK
jgi:hypothetical protein